MHWGLLALAFLVGAIVPVQVGLNAKLQSVAGPGLFAALVNMVVGAVALCTVLLLTRAPWRSAAVLGQAPAWAWLGGLMGVSFVAGALWLGPKLGAALLIALTVAGQMFAALALDHFGVLDYSPQPLNLWRAVGSC